MYFLELWFLQTVALSSYKRLWLFVRGTHNFFFFSVPRIVIEGDIIWSEIASLQHITRAVGLLCHLKCWKACCYNRDGHRALGMIAEKPLYNEVVFLLVTD